MKILLLILLSFNLFAIDPVMNGDVISANKMNNIIQSINTSKETQMLILPTLANTNISRNSNGTIKFDSSAPVKSDPSILFEISVVDNKTLITAKKKININVHASIVTNTDGGFGIYLSDYSYYKQTPCRSGWWCSNSLSTILEAGESIYFYASAELHPNKYQSLLIKATAL